MYQKVKTRNSELFIKAAVIVKTGEKFYENRKERSYETCRVGDIRGVWRLQSQIAPFARTLQTFKVTG